MKDQAKEIFDYLIFKETAQCKLYPSLPSSYYRELSGPFSDISEVSSLSKLIR